MVYEGREEPRINGLVDIVLNFPVLPAVKGLVAHRTGDMGWLIVRPPLMPLTAMQFEKPCEAIRRHFGCACATSLTTCT